MWLAEASTSFGATCVGFVPWNSAGFVGVMAAVYGSTDVPLPSLLPLETILLGPSVSCPAKRLAWAVVIVGSKVYVIESIHNKPRGRCSFVLTN